MSPAKTCAAWLGLAWLLASASIARADEASRVGEPGFTMGIGGGLGWGSRGGPSVLIETGLGKRYTSVELMFVPRLVVAHFHTEEAAAFELGAALRVFPSDRWYGEFAGGLALLPGTNGDSIPDSQPFVALAVGHELGRSPRTAYDLRAILNIELGVQNDMGPKTNMLSGLVGLGIRYY